ELGTQRDVAAVFAGHLKVTNPRGTGGLAGLVTPHLEATVKVELAVRLLSTRSGATLWRSSAWATERVGHVALVGGQLDFSAKDPKQAYGPLVNTLIRLVTQDMRSTWQQQWPDRGGLRARARFLRSRAAPARAAPRRRSLPGAARARFPGWAASRGSPVRATPARPGRAARARAAPPWPARAPDPPPPPHPPSST